MTVERRSPWQLTALARLVLSDAAQVVVGLWLADERYRDGCETPRLLYLAGNDGQSFAALVQQAGLWGRAMEILDELVMVGLVRQDPPDGLLLSRAAYTPAIGAEQCTTELATLGENR